MKKWLWITVPAVAGLALIAWGGSVLAQGPGNPPFNADNWTEMHEQCDTMMSEGGMMGGGMMGAGYMGIADTTTLTRVAGVLGLTYEQLTGRLTQGETIAQVAQTQKVATSLVVTSILAPETEILQVRVKYGYLSEAQAQAILEQARLQIERYISTATTARTNRPTGTIAPGYGQGGGMMGGGSMMGGGGMMGSGMMGGGMMGGGMMGR